MRSILRRNALLHARLLRDWSKLRREYRTALPELTSPERWRETFEAARPEEAEPFYTSTKLANCQSLSLHAPTRRLAVMSTNRGSNLNGRAVDKEGKYVANQSPITFFELPG